MSGRMWELPVEVSRAGAADVESAGIGTGCSGGVVHNRDLDGLTMSWDMSSKADARAHSRGKAQGSTDGAQWLMATPMKRHPRASLVLRLSPLLG